MSEQIGSNGNELTLIIPSTGQKNWSVSIKADCFDKISAHDHQGTGTGSKLVGYLSLDLAQAIVTNNVALTARDVAGTGVVNILKVDTNNELALGAVVSASSLIAGGLSILDDADNTKILAFNAASITSATTRTITMADFDINLSNYSALTDTGTTDEITVTGTAIGLADNPILPGTDSVIVPVGNTAQRVSTTNGALRYNSQLDRFEGYIPIEGFSEIGIGFANIELATKGDLVGHGDSVSEIIPVGEDGQVLVADSTESSGLRYSSMIGQMACQYKREESAASALLWVEVAYDATLDLYAAIAGSAVATAIMTSPDGNTWTTRTPSENQTWTGIASNGAGLFCAIGDDGASGRIGTSTDGITWTSRTASVTGAWRTMTWGGSQFVAMDSAGNAMTSPDGTTWTTRTYTADGVLEDMTYGNGIFVGVFSTGTNRIVTSTDGITWTGRLAAGTKSWYSVAYGNGVFVSPSSGSDKFSQISTDGLTWTLYEHMPVAIWRDIAYGNGVFMAMSSNGSTNWSATSIDGITWHHIENETANDYRGICFGNKEFVAVAVTGTNRVLVTMRVD